MASPALAQSLVAPPPPGSPIPRILPPATPRVAPGLAEPALPSPEETEGLGSVAVDGVTFEGASAYPLATLQQLAGPLVGPSVARQRIEQARLAILERYRQDGAVFTAVNAELDGRRLRFLVTEGYVATIEVEGDVGPVRAQVARFLSHLQGERPLRVAALERWMLLVTDIPGLSARAVLRPSSGEPGALTLVAQVSRKIVSGLTLLDNRAYQFTGPNEGLVSVDVNSLTQWGERTTFAFFHSFDQSQIFGQAASEMFLGGSGLKLRVYGGAGNTVPTGPLSVQGYFGFTTIFGGQLSYPLIRQRQQTLNLVAALDASENWVDENIGPDGAPARASFDSLRVLRAGADYAWLDDWAGESRSATNAATLRISQGLPLLGASANGAADAGRVGERIDFTKTSFELSRTQALFTPWTDAVVSLRTAAAGQYSANVLPPVEKFFLGGSRFNRGYYAGQVTGDSALTATAELQLDLPVSLGRDWPFAPTAQLYTFYDWGQTWESRSTDANHTLRSTGLGVRLYPTGTPQYEVDLEGVKRLTLYPNGSGPGVSALRGTAFYWQVLVRF
ncbi:MAG: ShlB/FhaC/HecB family hemolysin secretion/activation protein [Rhodospirillales bacterium]|nr:ShlB/FhaC/HecB family hemolysin secretion/activation protein [Rhodospirillales bacterium]